MKKIESSEREGFFKKHNFTLKEKYELLGTINDLLIAVWFLIGSFFFLSSRLVEDGTWLFILGSAQLLIKPTIKLAGLIHVKSAKNRSEVELI